MNESLAGLDVSLNNLRHIVTWIASSLLEDLSSSTDGTRIFSASHFGEPGTNEIIRRDDIVDCMEEKDFGQNISISQDSVKSITKFLKGLVGWREDSPLSVAQCLGETSCSNSSTEGREILSSTGNIN